MLINVPIDNLLNFLVAITDRLSAGELPRSMLNWGGRRCPPWAA